MLPQPISTGAGLIQTLEQHSESYIYIYMKILPDRRLVVKMKTHIYIIYIGLYKILVLRAQKELELHLWGGFQMILNFYEKYFLRVFCGGRTSICGGRRILLIFNKFQDFKENHQNHKGSSATTNGCSATTKNLKKYFS